MKLIKKISCTFLALFLLLSFLQGQASKKPPPSFFKGFNGPQLPFVCSFSLS